MKKEKKKHIIRSLLILEHIDLAIAASLRGSLGLRFSVKTSISVYKWNPVIRSPTDHENLLTVLTELRSFYLKATSPGLLAPGQWPGQWIKNEKSTCFV